MTGKKALKKANTYIATVAHELKNPLSAVFGYADILLDTDTGEGMTPRQKEILERIRATASKAVDLVKNYQFLAILEDSQTESQVRSDLTAVVSTVYETAWRDEEGGALIKLDLLNCPLLVYGSTLHVERIISNLFTNALKFTPPGGTITLKTALENNLTLFEIHNTGSWIDAADLASLFEMYSRGKRSESVPGAGLGLFIVKTVCNSINAQLNVESSATGGTLFRISLRSVVAQ